LWGRLGQTRFEEFPGSARELIDITAHGDWDEVGDQVNFKRGRPAFDSLSGPAGVKKALDYAVKYLGVVGPGLAKSPSVPQNKQGVAEVSDATKQSYKEKAQAQVRELEPYAKKGEYKDIAQRAIDRRQKGLARVPDEQDKINDHIVKVKGGYELKSKHGNKNLGKYPTRAGAEKRERQVQYFKHTDKEIETEDKIKGVDGKACWKGKRYAGKVKKADGTYKDKCVPVSENVENIMSALIDRIIVNEAISHNKR
jgi:hypothetical protein